MDLNPHYEDVLVNQGGVLMELGRPEKAALSFRQALELNPHLAGVHNNLGVALKKLGREDEALACYRQALQLDPQYADALDNMAIALKDKGELGQALASCQEALRCNPAHVNAANSMGVILQAAGKWEEATRWYERACAIAPGHASARWNLALVRLLQGDLQLAWPDYEYRWQVAGFSRRHAHFPLWNGASLVGKTILLHAEQGLGDTLQFVRYASLVKKRGGTVLFECPLPLVNLLDGVVGVDQIVPVGGPMPAFDVQMPLLSLPGVFGTTLATIPAETPYLHANPVVVDRWRQRLTQPATGGPRPKWVGIAWHGSSKHPQDRWRSIPLTYFGTFAGPECASREFAGWPWRRAISGSALPNYRPGQPV